MVTEDRDPIEKRGRDWLRMLILEMVIHGGDGIYVFLVAELSWLLV